MTEFNLKDRVSVMLEWWRRLWVRPEPTREKDELSASTKSLLLAHGMARTQDKGWR